MSLISSLTPDCTLPVSEGMRRAETAYQEDVPEASKYALCHGPVLTQRRTARRAKDMPSHSLHCSKLSLIVSSCPSADVTSWPGATAAAAA